VSNYNIEKIDKIVLFDGVCNFCESSVQFIIKHDKTNTLKFASLQSETGLKLLQHYHMSSDLEGVVFIENKKAYFKSKAAFEIAKYFGGIWAQLRIFRILPLFLTDFVYDIVANNRYKWFGKKDACMLPSPEIRSRFLDV
jgi:predicted DCC family thiol-disulfide oxidoreductase YuxK